MERKGGEAMERLPEIDRTAYDNAPFIPNGQAYWARWEAAAAAFRARHDSAALGRSYGAHPREAYDLFMPVCAPRGLFVFVHGGFWRIGGRELWSHLSTGALAAGFAVAIPSYPLCPEVRIAHITQAVARALPNMADQVAGPIRLVGHSAGGHLVLRVACADARLPPDVRARIDRICAISPLANLAPLIDMPMNSDLRIDAAEAAAESPVHHTAPSISVSVVVGADERPAFLDQALWMVDAWPKAQLSVLAGKHHFNVIEGLQDPQDPLLAPLV